MKEIANYAKNSGHTEHVLFDIFDTIITRTVHPEYVKLLAAKRICLLKGLKILPLELYYMRGKIEAEQRENNMFDGYDAECTFEEVCSDLYEKLYAIEPEEFITTSKQEFIKLCKEGEIYAEKKVQRLDENCKKALDTLTDAGILISCVSDFYLPKSMIIEFFRYHGIEKYFKNIYVSCDYKKTKGTGKLYDVVLRDLKTKPSNVVMLGDNLESDIISAESRGIRSKLINREKQKKFYKKHFSLSWHFRKAEKGLLSAYRAATKDLKYLTFSEAVFPLFHFIQKLHANLIRDKVKDIFFLSKEGEFLKKLFEIYQESNDYDEGHKIRAHYLLASRRATYMPSRSFLEEENFKRLFREFRELSFKEFLESLNIEIKDCEKIFKEFGIDPEKRIWRLNKKRIFKDFISHPIFEFIYENKRTEQGKNFKEYIKIFGVDIEKNGLNLVDVGWKGSIQDNIFNIYEGEIKIHGYYLGLTEPGDAPSIKNIKDGILFRYLPPKTPYFRVYYENWHLFECILGATHGSAKYYSKEGEKPTVILDTVPEEDKLFVEIIKPLQDNIEVRFEVLCKITAQNHFHPEEYDEFIAKRFAKSAFLPSSEELEFFSKLYHYHNFGYFQKIVFRKKGIKFTEKYKNFKMLLKNPYASLFKEYWPSLTLVNMGLSPLRYVYGAFRIWQMYIYNGR